MSRPTAGAVRAQAPAQVDGPKNPTELGASSWKYIIRRTINEFRRDGCLDLSAGLAFRSALAAFPVLLVAVAALGLLGSRNKVIEFIVQTIQELGYAETAAAAKDLFDTLSQAPDGYAFTVGLVLLLWSASGYLSAFGRAMNRVYGQKEGRSLWKTRIAFVPLAALIVVMMAIAAFAVTIGDAVADTAVEILGIEPALVIAWNILRFPVALILMLAVFALLYYFTPNVRHPKVRWVSVGALVAVVVWILASVGFTIYFANFSSFERSYGAIGGALVFLLWLWLTNWSLLAGGEFDAELERMRQLRSGLDAEKSISVPMRQSRNVTKAASLRIRDVLAAQEIKDHARRNDAPTERNKST
ncbi:YihY/virulence factor BrkB family protein [Homoserinimonas sp. OAct 916]|uniref:YihY/virulence factor BrkB family protein n=1 Tax=Homoserinimonas sp. OAct 916 TaxID=2211450 RepID=UPI000DBE28CF|nr:YihY/virulence factor BrkB family protein [Homoserinimonas sp. OAct 916]